MSSFLMGIWKQEIMHAYETYVSEGVWKWTFKYEFDIVNVLLSNY